ncbi:MAG: polysaccharide biosynthesis/export family protein [Hoeflea alexandrii]
MKPAKSKATHLLAAAMTAVMLAGCSGYQPAPRAFHEAVMQPYRLDAGDRLRVTVFEQDGLTGTYTIDQSGYIAFPLIGAVPARGRTLQELEGNIAVSLRQGYLRDPDVSIEIDRYRSFYIMGEVGQAGQYSYVAGMTVQNAIAIAGGLFLAGKPAQCRYHPEHQRENHDRQGSDHGSDPRWRHHLCA